MAQTKFAPETIEQRRARLQAELSQALERRSSAIDGLIAAHDFYLEADRAAGEARQRLQDLESGFISEALRGLDRLRLAPPR